MMMCVVWEVCVVTTRWASPAWQGSFWFSDYYVLYPFHVGTGTISHAIFVINTWYFRLGAPIATGR